MAVTLINLDGFQSGIVADESGINIKTFKRKIEPEFNNIVPKKDGTARGRVVAPMKLNVSMDGEVNDTVGVMAATAVAAYTPANSTAFFGAPTTGLYLLNANVDDSRENGALQEMSAEFEALAGIP